jgi:hypothetical protein
MSVPRGARRHPRFHSGNAVLSGKTRQWAPAMLTKEIISGFNILSLAGFAVMGLTLALSRSGRASKSLSIGLMTAGTALVFFGLYAGDGARW